MRQPDVRDPTPTMARLTQIIDLTYRGGSQSLGLIRSLAERALLDEQAKRDAIGDQVQW